MKTEPEKRVVVQAQGKLTIAATEGKATVVGVNKAMLEVK